MSTCNVIVLTCNKKLIRYELKKNSDIINNCRQVTFNMPDATYIYVDMQLIHVDMQHYKYIIASRHIIK